MPGAANVTSANIIVGETDVKVGNSNTAMTLTDFDALTSVGATQGGVEIAWEPNMVDIEVDQWGDAAKVIQSTVKVVLKTTLAEATLKNLALAWNYDNTDSGSTGASAGTAPSVKVVDGLDLERLFGQAREDYIKARYDLAYQGFKTVYERDVGGSYKEQALYWMAECMWKSDRQDDALELYQRVLNEFPNGDKMCSARFKMGLIYNDKQDNLRRNNAWSQLIDACPQSNEANRARDMMHP